MTNKIRKAMSTGMLGIALLAGNAEAQSLPSLNNLAGRAKMEYNGDLYKDNTLKEIIAFGPKGSYDGRTSVFGQFVETGRYVSSQSLTSGDTTHMLGIRTEPRKWLGIDSSFVPANAIFFGSVKDSLKNSSSFGSEMRWNADKFETVARGEYQNKNPGISHLGGTLRYLPSDNWTLQVGYDGVKQDSKNFNQLFGNISLTPGKNDLFGLSFARQEMLDNSENYRIRFTGAHFGKNTSWGHRSFAEYSFNPKNDQSAVTAQMAVVPFGSSTYSKIAARLFTEDLLENDSAFEVVKTPFALYTEAVPHFDRITGKGLGLEGLGFVANLSFARAGATESKLYSGQIHYVGRCSENKVGQNEFGFYAGPRHTTLNKAHSTYIDAGATLRFGKNFGLRAAFGFPIDTTIKQKPQGTLEAEVKF